LHRQNKTNKIMKKNIMFEISAEVDTDIDNLNDIVDNLDISIEPNSENVEVTRGPSTENFYTFLA